MYITTDENGLITGAFEGIEKQDGMTEVKTAETAFFSQSGVSLFLLTNGVLVKRAQEEVEQEEALKETQQMPSEADRLTAVENALMELMLGGETNVPIS